MSRQQKPSRLVSVDEQIQVVLAVLKGQLPLAEAVRRHVLPVAYHAHANTMRTPPKMENPDPSKNKLCQLLDS
ncbi:hypothetical protein [Streptomyces sp. NPDC001970]